MIIRVTSILARIGAGLQVSSGGSGPDARPTIFTPNGAPKKAFFFFFFFFVGAGSRNRTPLALEAPPDPCLYQLLLGMLV